MSLTDLEKQLVFQLRARFADGELNERQKEDYNLVEWLRAKDNILDGAEVMLRNSLKFRKENDLDNYKTWEVPEEIKQWSPMTTLGLDDDNCVVLWGHVGQTQYDKILETKQNDTYVKYICQRYEMALEESRGKLTRQGLPAKQITLIFDMNGISVWALMNKSVFNLNMDCNRVLEENYPGVVKAYIYINGGNIFSTMFPVIKACMSRQTASVLSVYNSPSKWKPALKELIPENILPPELK